MSDESDRSEATMPEHDDGGPARESAFFRDVAHRSRPWSERVRSRHRALHLILNDVSSLNPDDDRSFRRSLVSLVATIRFAVRDLGIEDTPMSETMPKPDDGGPAFPGKIDDGMHNEGMSLHVFYAGLAMQALVSVVAKEPRGIDSWRPNPKHIAKYAIEYADAMIAEMRRREKTGAPEGPEDC